MTIQLIMPRQIRMALYTSFVLITGLTSSVALADALPIKDGVYLTDQKMCQQLFDGEMDMVELTVEEGGHSYAYEEGFCVTGDVKKITDKRFSVSGDCDEFGELSTESFFLEIETPTRIRKNGELYHLCVPPESSELETTPEWISFLAMPVDTVCLVKMTKSAPQYWFLDETDDYEDPKGLDFISNLDAGDEVWILNSQNNGKLDFSPNDEKMAFGFKGYYFSAENIEFTGKCSPSR